MSAYNNNLQNVECQRLLPSCGISSKSPSSPSEQLQHLVTLPGGVSVSSNQCPYVVWLTAMSQCIQIFRVAKVADSISFYGCITIGLESSVHSACRVLLWMLLEQRWNLTVRCYDHRSDVYENFWALMVWQTSCWNGCDVDLRVVMMTFIRGIFKQMLTTFAKCKLQICNSVEQ